MTQFVQLIRRWFDEEWGGGLVLPDGWYGRPYDSQFALTFLEESDNRLTIGLSDKLTLSFEGLKSVESHGRELVFGSFEKLRFDWQEFGKGTRSGTKEYRAGEAKIIAAPGKRCP